MRKSMLTALFAVSAANLIASAATAQNSPFTPGEYEEISMIDVVDGGELAYANFLASTWRKNQEFAKSQGWITGYQVLSNQNPRPGEPDLYLVTTFASMPDAAEDEKRTAAYRAFMKQNDAQMATASGDRLKVRTVMGSFLLRRMMFK